MKDLSQYTSGDLVFNEFLQVLSKREAQVFRTVLKILYRSFFLYLATESEKDQQQRGQLRSCHGEILEKIKILKSL